MDSKLSSITVTVRVRPFTEAENARLVQAPEEPAFFSDGALYSNPTSGRKVSGSKYIPKGLRKTVNVVDDRMLIFDPPETNPMVSMQQAAFPGKTTRFKEHRFVFDRLFDENASQKDVYNNTTRPLLDSVLDGFNATVFAYGATGCGKTHTITGTPEDPGIIFLTMQELFERIDSLQDSRLFDVSLSYLEIYNETIRDLLKPVECDADGNPVPGSPSLQLREDENKRISVVNLSLHKPRTVHDVMDMIVRGNAARTVSPTEANATSSRSHAVLQINVAQKNRTAAVSEEHVFATLSIIDLAGSERASATKNRGERLAEGANINKSLLALGNCINALCDVRRRNHVPYRDSKLTRLLKFSLGGNCKTVMIVCISPSSQHYDETLNTLKYADRAKQIKTKVIRNHQNLDRHVSSYLKMITQQKAEIEELRAREASVADRALAKAAQSRSRTEETVKEALKALDDLFVKTEAPRTAKAKLIIRLHTVRTRQQQMELWLRYLRDVSEVVSALPEAGTAASSVARRLSHLQSLSVTLVEKLTQECQYLQNIYDNMDDQPQPSDIATLRAAVQTLSLRLRETEGVTDYDLAVFETHSAYVEARMAKAALEPAVDNLLSLNDTQNTHGAFSFLCSLFGDLLSRLAELTTEAQFSEQIAEEVAQLVGQTLDEASKIFTASIETPSGDFRDVELSSSTEVHQAHTHTPSVKRQSTEGVYMPKIRSKMSPMPSPAGIRSSKRVSFPGRKSLPPIAKIEKKKPVKRVRWEDVQCSPKVQDSIIEQITQMNSSRDDISMDDGEGDKNGLGDWQDTSNDSCHSDKTNEYPMDTDDVLRDVNLPNENKVKAELPPELQGSFLASILTPSVEKLDSKKDSSSDVKQGNTEMKRKSTGLVARSLKPNPVNTVPRLASLEKENNPPIRTRKISDSGLSARFSAPTASSLMRQTEKSVASSTNSNRLSFASSR